MCHLHFKMTLAPSLCVILIKRVYLQFHPCLIYPSRRSQQRHEMWQMPARDQIQLIMKKS